jgi:predicted 3-demethylubiquinone-9 3-methyltransferase (glyoxalase superfamily)
MQKIIPCLWFDNQAEEAMYFYTSMFNDAKIGNVTRYGEAGPGPTGSVLTASFELLGQEFTALNGGPMFKFTPALSFFVNCETEAEVDKLWEKLASGGTVLMELDTYPFSKKFGWVEDQFGISWQLNLASRKQKIVPAFLFVGEQNGKAEEAMHLYTSLFKNSSILRLERHRNDEQEPEGTVQYALFELDGQEFMAMDSNRQHPFTFTPAISFFVNCQTQEEVDELWEKLSFGGEKEQCGWLRDKYGVSWQIVPTVLGELLGDPDPERAQRVMKAMLQMQKLDIKTLRQAYEPN